MQSHVQGERVPGLVTLLNRRGETVVDAIGTLAFGSSTPMRRDTIFRVASISKPVTAAAAMILVEEGKLRLDDPVDKFLPELKDRKVLRSLESPARRHGSREPADHCARSAHIPRGARRDHGVSVEVSDSEGDGGNRRRRGPVPLFRRGQRRIHEADRQPPACAPAGREVALSHRSRHPRRAARTRLGQVARRFPARADFRSAWHEGYGLPCPGREDRPPRHRIHNGFLERPAR